MSNVSTMTPEESAKWYEIYTEAQSEPLKYLKHDTNAHQDEEIRRMCYRHGWDWIGMYWTLAELLGSKRGHCYQIYDDVDWQFLLADMRRLAGGAAEIDMDTLQEFIAELADRELIIQEVYEQGRIRSARIDETAADYADDIAPKRFGAWKRHRN